MGGILLILLGVFFFTFIVLLLVMLIILAKSWLVPSGQVQVIINDDPNHTYQVGIGDKLLNTLSNQKIYLPPRPHPSGAQRTRIAHTIGQALFVPGIQDFMQMPCEEWLS